MSRRRSIVLEGYTHGGQPIPAASRIGNTVMSGGIFGLDRATGKIADEADRQVSLLFTNLKDILAAANASLDDVIKMTFWVKESAVRGMINEQWVLHFPDASSRPARHTFQADTLPANVLVMGDAVAIVG